MKVWVVGGAAVLCMSVVWLLVASRTITNINLCGRAVHGVEEEYTQRYSRRNLGIDLDGPVYAAWKWEGQIQRKDFELGLDTGAAKVAFKVLNSKLFVKRDEEGMETASGKKEVFEDRLDAMVELLLLVIHMYDIPDMDFIVDLGDEVGCGEATLSYFINATCADAGFSIPSQTVYLESMGPQQFDGLSKCLQYQYPYSARIPKGLWYMPTDDAEANSENLFGGSNMGLESVAMRWPNLVEVVPVNRAQGISNEVKLVSIQWQLSDQQSEILSTDNGKALITTNAITRGWIAFPAPTATDLQHLNEYAVVLCTDDETMCSRLGQFLSYNTPVLKQASVIQEYFGHLLEPGVHLETFNQDLSDLVPYLASMIIDSESWWSRRKLLEMVSNMHGFAREHTSHLGVVRAAAYALNIYASKLAWDTHLEEGYKEVPKSLCCKTKTRNNLPLKLMYAVSKST